MTYRAFELAVDILLSRSSGPLRSVFELPSVLLQRAYQDSLSPEEFVASLQDHKSSEPKTKDNSGDTGDLFG